MIVTQRQARRRIMAMPESERWGRLLTMAGTLAQVITRKGISASELRDEKLKRTDDFGSELPTCRRHGSKGSTKPLPGKRKSAGIGQVNNSIRVWNSAIKAGLIPVRVVKAVGQTRSAVSGTLMVVR